MGQKRTGGDSRTPEQIKEHYEIEKELASKLRHASRDERGYLYRSVYDEMFRRVPLHPMLTQKASPADSAEYVEKQLNFLKRFLYADATFMEVGPGDCALACAVARLVREVYAVDVSDEISRRMVFPGNLRLILSDGCSIPLPRCSIDIAYSNQLMEHLHPDDALEQLRNIHAALVPGGIYACITPNGLTGPHDVSRGFDRTATGFHLKEYAVFELDGLFRHAGFAKVRFFIGGKGVFQACPTGLLKTLERPLHWPPSSTPGRIARTLPFGPFVNVIRVVGTK